MSTGRAAFSLDKVATIVLAVLLTVFGFLIRQLETASARVSALSERLSALEASNASEHRAMRQDIRELKRTNGR
jgi:cell division protein FtsB